MGKAGSILKGKWKKCSIIGIILILLFLMLGGCSRWLAGYGIIPDNESLRQRKAYEEKGEEIMSEYLADNFPDAEITWCTCWDIDDDKHYLTDYVHGTFQIGEESYTYYVNVYTGEVYTGYYQEEIVNRVYPQVCERLGIENYTINYGSAVGKYVPVTENEELDSYEMGKTMWVPVSGDIGEGELDEFIAGIFAGNDYCVDFSISYDDDIRIEDMDFNELKEEFQGIRFFLRHRKEGTLLNHKTTIGQLEELYFAANWQYRYSSYNIVEQDNMFLVYEEYSSVGDADVAIDAADKIKPDNFSVKKDDEKIEVRLKEPARYYLCFSDTGFLGTEGLYYYGDEAQRYVKADIKEDEGLGHYAVYAQSAGPGYYEKSETFYIGMPSTEGSSKQDQP